MSTRATIQFKGRDEVYFIYKHSDGYPEGVLPELDKLMSIDGIGSQDMALIATRFLINSNLDSLKNSSLCFELTSCEHGDESYRYLVYQEYDVLSNGKKKPNLKYRVEVI